MVDILPSFTSYPVAVGKKRCFIGIRVLLLLFILTQWITFGMKWYKKGWIWSRGLQWKVLLCITWNVLTVLIETASPPATLGFRPAWLCDEGLPGDGAAIQTFEEKTIESIGKRSKPALLSVVYPTASYWNPVVSKNHWLLWISPQNTYNFVTMICLICCLSFSSAIQTPTLAW